MERLERRDAPALAWAVHEGSSPVLGSVLLVHGYQDHSGRYSHVVERWTARGFNVGRLDLRGHGQSAGTRGSIARFADYIRDVADVLDELEKNAAWNCRSPQVLFGHSLGALVATHFALSYPDRVRGLALSSPFFALALQAPAYKLVMGRALSRVLPNFALPSGIPIEFRTSCQQMQAECRQDTLRFEEARARWFTETMRAQEELAIRAGEVSVPVYCLAAGRDRIADVERTKRILARVPRAELTILPEHEHEVLHETARSAHIESLGDCIERWLIAPAP